MESFAAKKNLRVMRIGNMARLTSFASAALRGLQIADRRRPDGAVVVRAGGAHGADRLPARGGCHQGRHCHRSSACPTPQEYRRPALRLAGRGRRHQQLRALRQGRRRQSASAPASRTAWAWPRSRATRPIASWPTGSPGSVRQALQRTVLKFGDDRSARPPSTKRSRACHGGLPGSCMVSDAFFPFRDGVEVGIREGVTAIVQPGGRCATGM
jgi:phosphoribosylaminoimidazolecarboxamide formyltransferase/IMP cyclohydrolase